MLYGTYAVLFKNRHEGGKIGSDGLRDYNYIVKSNAMDSLVQKCAIGTNGAPVTPCKATFTGKSNVRAVDRQTGVSYTLGADAIGNQQYFQVDVTDNGEPGASSSTTLDEYAIPSGRRPAPTTRSARRARRIDSPSTMLALQGETCRSNRRNNSATAEGSGNASLRCRPAADDRVLSYRGPRRSAAAAWGRNLTPTVGGRVRAPS